MIRPQHLRRIPGWPWLAAGCLLTTMSCWAKTDDLVGAQVSGNGGTGGGGAGGVVTSGGKGGGDIQAGGAGGASGAGMGGRGGDTTEVPAGTAGAGGGSIDMQPEVPVLPDTVPPQITATLPADNADGVEPEGPIRITFSEAVDPASLTESTFIVTTGGVVTKGAITVAGNVATFTPEGRLALATRSEVSVMSAKDLAGNPLAAGHKWSFATRDGSWRAPVMLSATGGSASELDLTTDGAGHVTVLFMQADGAEKKLYFARHVSGVWAEAKPVPTTPVSRLPIVRANPRGVAFGLWTSANGRSLCSRFTASGGWEAARDVGISSGGIPALAVDDAGGAIAMWEAEPGGTLEYAAYVAAQGWIGFGKLPGVSAALHQSVSALPDGRYVAFWWGGASVYNPSNSAWDSPNPISSGAVNIPVLTTLADGSALAVWAQADGNFFSRYAAGAWSPAAIAFSGDLSHLSRERTDFAIAASASQIVVFSNGSWGAPTPLGAVANQIHAGTDGLGRGFVAWDQGTGAVKHIWAKRFVKGTGWGTAVQLDKLEGSASSPIVTVSRGGQATAAWTQYDGQRNVLMTARFD